MEDYSQHTAWSDPGPWRARVADLPSDPAAIPDALENFVIHHAIARSIGIEVPKPAEADRDLRSLPRLIGNAMDRDSRPLTEHRALPDYLYGTCHDFALFAAAALRERGIAARLRVGYAGYFIPDRWEDHWICEYRTSDRWAMLDAQLGPRARGGFKIGFPVADVPASGWRSAASIWLALRAGSVDPDACGVRSAGIQGAWFVASAVLRDAAALAGIECLPWDYWGPARRFRANRKVTEGEARNIDALAAALEPAPASLTAAKAILDQFSWARPTTTVESMIVTTPTETPILPAPPPDR